jgi:hypothetical protein
MDSESTYKSTRNNYWDFCLLIFRYIPTSSDPKLGFFGRIVPVKKEKKEKGKKKPVAKDEDEGEGGEEEGEQEGQRSELLADIDLEGTDLAPTSTSSSSSSTTTTTTTTTSAPASTSNSALSEPFTWPGNKWLTLRFKQALKDIEVVRKQVMKKMAQEAKRQRKKEKKEKRRLEKKLKKEAAAAENASADAELSDVEESESAKKKKRNSTPKSRVKNEWSKRELSAFYRVVTTHGIPLKKDSGEYDFEYVLEKVTFYLFSFSQCLFFWLTFFPGKFDPENS